VNVLCDDCFYKRDFSSPMDGPIEVQTDGPSMTRMVAYQCSCRRLYSSSLGYFTLGTGILSADSRIAGEGLKNVQKLAPCNSPRGEPMYLAEVLEDGRLRLKCLKCDYERIVVR